MKELSRRNFLGGAALGVAGLATVGLAGCSTGASSSAGEASWDAEADVVVCGGGGTGLAAACAAAEGGASVLCYEALETPGGTSAMSGGVMQAAGTKWQKELSSFKDDSPEIHAACYVKQSEGLGDEELIKVVCDGAPAGLEWLESLGVKWNTIYGNNHVPYCDAENLHADRIHAYEGGGAAFGGKVYTDLEFAEAERLGVQFVFQALVKSLIVDSDIGVQGVEVEVEGETLRVKARKGVVLGLGGIDRNIELAKALNQQMYWDLTTQASHIAATANGDGIRMGLEVQAALATVGGCIDHCGVTAAATNNHKPELPAIYINAAGSRFVCEDATYAYTYRAIFQQCTQLNGDTWKILDQNMVEQGVGPWAEDPAAAVEEGILIQADSYAELAEAIGVSVSTFEATMARWNTMMETVGEDVDYHRLAQLIPLNKPPYYAQKNTSANLGSLGGLKITSKTEVVDIHGEIIPRLFAAGMNSGGWYGLYYPGSGTSLTGGLVLGRVAGAEAALLENWG